MALLCAPSALLASVLHDASIFGQPRRQTLPQAMARPLELTLACVLALMGGVYLLRSSRAEQARHQAELAAAVARRASLSEGAARGAGGPGDGAEVAGRRAREFDASAAAAAAAAADPTVTLPAQALRARRDDNDAAVATAPSSPSPLEPAQLKDFPCALRDFKVAKVTKTCELLCKEATCARALKHCERLVECDAVVVDGQEIKAGHNRDLSKATVRLLRDDAARAAADESSNTRNLKMVGSALKQQTSRGRTLS